MENAALPFGLIGIGIDIESIDRFREKPFASNVAFYKKLFTKREIAYCLKKADPSQHFAVRFCAKESLIKAIGTDVVDRTSIEICMRRGRPTIGWSGGHVLLSLSHDQDKAVACVVVLRKKLGYDESTL